jgi:hypothetical protein
VGWPTFGGLRRDELAGQVHHHDPCAPVALGEPLAAIARPGDEAGTDRSRREPSPVHRHRRSPVGGWRHAANRLVQQACQLVFAGPTHTPLQRRVIGHPLDGQRGAQLIAVALGRTREA